MNRNHITSRHLSSLLRSSKGLTSEGLDCRACRALGLFSLRLPPPSKAVKSTVGVYAGWLPEKTLIPPIALRYEPTRRDNRGLILGFFGPFSSNLYLALDGCPSRWWNLGLWRWPSITTQRPRVSNPPENDGSNFPGFPHQRGGQDWRKSAEAISKSVSVNYPTMKGSWSRE